MSEPRVTEAAPAMPADPVVSPADTIRRYIRTQSMFIVGFSGAQRDALAAVDEWEAVGERNRRQIARLTDALKLIAALPVRFGGEPDGGYWAALSIARGNIAPRAVLADKEDANG